MTIAGRMIGRIGLCIMLCVGGRTPAVAAEPGTAPHIETPIQPLVPNQGELAHSLQLWLRADLLTLNDGEPVYVWPDQSGHGRDVSITKGVRTDGVGLAGKFFRASSLMKRPAVRFDSTTGYATSPQRPVDIRGDAALSITLVINLQPHDAQPPYDGVLGIGNPAYASDPGRPLAALIQINRGEDHALHFAGGWNHDASLGAGSFKPYYGTTTILSVIKQPGPMRTATSLFINGEAVLRPDGAPLEGRDTIPDIQHRTDIGAYLGKAVSWAGAIQGDVGEVLVYNTALTDSERLGVEGHLADKFGMLLKPFRDSTTLREAYTPEERAYWAYQPVTDPTPPVVADANWVKSPVDRFVLAELEFRKLLPAPPAEKLALLRRVTFDLTGLPPSVEDVSAFLNDDSAQAWERVVNRLLDSPHYGERWARHWLDLVRFAESTANDANAVMRYAWRYRDYVIDAFNSDLPYDQFLIEQLAGDLLPPSDSAGLNLRRVIATGYLMIGPKALAETDKEQSRLDIVDDQIDVTGRAMLGLTLACARCHDHKFDAIRTADYYALAGIFRSTEPFQNENRNASMWWEFPVPQPEPAEPVVVMAPKESAPRSLRVHMRGSRFSLGAQVPRGFPQVVSWHGLPSGSEEVNFEDSGRLALAHWVAHAKNPLTARVMVNRIWQHHFGRGLVGTSDNFGVRGDRPTHPDLLDWLASRFLDSGWSMKAMHRLMVLSNTYQQSGRAELATRQADPDSRWLSSYPRRRLSAEELRDAVLAVSGTLDRQPGRGESGEFLFGKAEDIKAQIRPNRVAADDPYYSEFAKRSVYLPLVRNMLPDVLALFDGADPNGVTAVRNDTTVPSQSLFMLNSPFIRAQALAWAQRLLHRTELDLHQRIDAAHRLAFARPATVDELQQGSAFLAEYVSNPLLDNKVDSDRQQLAWQSYCQTLLCANEFLYVE